MKNDILYDKINSNHEAIVLRTLKLIESKLEQEIASKPDIIKWQQEELKRLQSEVLEKSSLISELNTKLIECRSQAEGNRQLINKLITDIDKLRQNLDWYKRTYESRSLLGVIKDKLKHFFVNLHFPIIPIIAEQFIVFPNLKKTFAIGDLLQLLKLTWVTNVALTPGYSVYGT